MKLSLLTQLALIIFFLNSPSFAGQVAPKATNDQKFNEIYVKIATEVSSSNINKAFKMADSLLASTSDNFQKMKCLMLMATLNQREGNIVKAISLAFKADALLSNDKRFEIWKVRIPGFLSTLYRTANLNQQARKYLEIAERENSKQIPSIGVTISHALLLQEKAYYAMEEDKDYNTALSELAASEKRLLKVPDYLNRDIFLGTNNQLIGLCYLKIKNYEKAESHFQLAIKELGATESEIKAFIYCGFGDLYTETGKYADALKYFEKAKPYVNNSNNFNAKITLNMSLATYYRNTGNPKLALKYQELYSSLVNEQTQTTKAISDQLIREMQIEQKDSSALIQLLIIVAIVLIALIIILLYVYKANKKANRIKYEQIIAKIKSVQNTSAQDFLQIQKNEPILKQMPQSIMTNESESRLLDSLNKLESKNFFLKGDISLSSVASKLNSNTKYISYIINKYKGKDFNNYINELRIDYALNDLRIFPDVRRYKISYLAIKYGFSSHSKFAAIFKATTGISPSVYIENLKKDDNIIQLKKYANNSF